MFWYVIGTAVINNMLKFMTIYPKLRSNCYLSYVQENSKFSSRLVVAAGTAVASHPYVRVRLYRFISPKISLSQNCYNAPILYTAAIFVKYCFRTGRWSIVLLLSSSRWCPTPLGFTRLYMQIQKLIYVVRVLTVREKSNCETGQLTIFGSKNIQLTLDWPSYSCVTVWRQSACPCCLTCLSFINIQTAPCPIHSYAFFTRKSSNLWRANANSTIKMATMGVS